MTQAEKNAGKFTFGNILLVLLVIGTFVVGGLMYKLYQQLTETPEKTANWHEQQKQQQQVEVISPNGKPDERVYRPAGASAAQTEPTTPTQTAKQPHEYPVSEPDPVNSDALTGGTTPAPRKNATKKTTAQPNNESERTLKPEPSQSNSLPGEVPLRPTNAPNKQPSEVKERPLKPQPSGSGQKSKSSDAIDELF